MTLRVCVLPARPSCHTYVIPMTMHVSDDQVQLFKSLFTGRSDVYGTYDPRTHRSWQVKRPVTDQVIRDHLQGGFPFGVYLLEGEKVAAAVADFDQDETGPPLSFQEQARKLGLPVYIERSKSMGYHVWMFFSPGGVLASKARNAFLGLLERINVRGTEIFPKQDKLTNPTQFGNFINTPLFGGLLRQGRCVFVDEQLQPYPDQWAILRIIERVSEGQLDRTLGVQTQRCAESEKPICLKPELHRTGLPPCAQRMLQEGVSANQRVACFRLACQLRKAGVDFDQAVRILNAWSLRNRPSDGKGMIKPHEVHGQTRCAYQGRLDRACGCEDPAVIPFCEASCGVRRR